jgi:hypothetical protein
MAHMDCKHPIYTPVRHAPRGPQHRTLFTQARQRLSQTKQAEQKPNHTAKVGACHRHSPIARITCHAHMEGWRIQHSTSCIPCGGWMHSPCRCVYNAIVRIHTQHTAHTGHTHLITITHPLPHHNNFQSLISHHKLSGVLQHAPTSASNFQSLNQHSLKHLNKINSTA